MSETVFSIEEWQAAMLRAETAADKARAMKHLIAAAEERGRQRAIEVLKLMHLHEHVPSHVALLIGAIANIRALAPRDSAPGLKLRSDPRFDPDDEIAPRDSAPKPGISDEKIRELLQRGERDRRIAEGNNVAPRDSGKEMDVAEEAIAARRKARQDEEAEAFKYADDVSDPDGPDECEPRDSGTPRDSHGRPI